MKLVNADFGLVISFSENQAVELVVENPAGMSSIVGDFRRQCEGDEGNFVLSENDKILKPDKVLDIIINPFELSFNERKIMNKLYVQLEEFATDYYERKEELHRQIILLLEDILMATPYHNIVYNLECDWTSLFKLYNIRFDDQAVSLLEHLVEYIKLIAYLTDIRLLCFVNIKDYLAQEEVTELYQSAFSHKINLLLIESKEYEERMDEKIFIIDKDKCLIIK